MDQQGRTRIVGCRWRAPALGLLLLGLAIAGWLWTPRAAKAQASAPDQACILCHSDTDEKLVLPSGEVLDVQVDVDALDQSVHGAHAGQDVYCTDCHQDRQRYLYPHHPNPAQSLKEFVAEVSQNCEICHTPLELHNPGHLQVENNPNIPTCANCHGAHDVAPTEPMQADMVGFCQGCHATYDDPHVGEVHAELVANMRPGQNCLLCHGDVQQTADAQCQACHGLLTSQLTLESGETIDLHVDPNEIIASQHGERILQGVHYAALQCTDCHTDIARYGFPHPPLTETTQRGLTVQMEQICQQCHQEIYEKQMDGIHQQAIERGNLDAATCADCHGNHNIQEPDVPRERISQTCGQCHGEINELYSQSVHGAALLGEQNPDVPVCTDCHGVHDIENPTTAAFRANSPTLCAGCHADETMMAKYGISTEVFETYVADFHGTTVALFEKHSPDQPTNKAVCYDCHGIHNILPVTDVNSRVIKQNLLATCRECHPDATENFPSAWMSHYRPSLEHNTLVYLVDLFYKILIPGVVGAFVLFIGTDIYRRGYDWMRRRKEAESEPEETDVS
jgi:predicted CXXCH cytochrome family protein